VRAEMFSLFYFLTMNITSNFNYNERRLGLPLDRIVHSARLLSLTKDKKWLHKIIDRGLIRTWDEGIIVESDSQKDRLKAFIDIMIEGFSRRYGNNWDVHLSKVNNRQYTINFFTIFPSTTITNRDGNSHVIKDLIVLFPIACSTDDNFYITRIQGGRATYYQKELDNQYSHSHLRSSVSGISVDEPFYTNDFCIGAGDLSFLEGVLRNNFNVRDLEAYLYEIDATIQWESIEGTPYKHIRDLTSTRSSIVREGSYSVSGFTSNFSNDLDVDFYISNNTYKIKFNSTFKSFIRSILDQNLSEYGSLRHDILCVYNPVTRRYYRAESSQTQEGYIPDIRTYGGENAYTIYNGQKKYFSIKATPIRANAPQEVYIIYPKFLKDVHTQFEKLLHEKTVRQSAISKYHSAEYQSSYSTQNSVSL
jgi:hypothetical protein